MDKTVKLRLQLAVDQVDTWDKEYRKVTAQRNAVRSAAGGALKTLRAGLIPVVVGAHTYQVLPLSAPLLDPLRKFAAFIQMPPISATDHELLHQLDEEVPTALAEARRALASKRPSADDVEAGEFLVDYASWGLGAGISEALGRIIPSPAPDTLTLAQALDPQTGLANALKAQGLPELLPGNQVSQRLATFSAAEPYSALARAITPATEFVIVCCPPGTTAADFLNAIEEN